MSAQVGVEGLVGFAVELVGEGLLGVGLAFALGVAADPGKGIYGFGVAIAGERRFECGAGVWVAEGDERALGVGDQ